MKKSQAFLYTNKRKPIHGRIPIHNCYKDNKIPRSTNNKGCKNLFKENYKPLKEIRGDKNRWKNIPYLWLGRINIMKMDTLPKVIYRFNTISIKLPLIFFQNWKNRLKFHMEPKDNLHSQDNPKQKEQSWRHHAA